MKIIAEIGSVHDGKINLAIQLIKLATKCGVDIVKFQMHLAEHETLKKAPSPKYFKIIISIFIFKIFWRWSFF